MAFRWCCLAVICVGLSGCEMLHNLQPHRLRRLNYVPPPHLDPEFTLREPQHAEPIPSATVAPGVGSGETRATSWRSLRS